jgi:hypothetical protein
MQCSCPDVCAAYCITRGIHANKCTCKQTIAAYYLCLTHLHNVQQLQAATKHAGWGDSVAVIN